jgi:hypothetical protein
MSVRAVVSAVPVVVMRHRGEAAARVLRLKLTAALLLL